jgi:hypothetical protein
VRALLKHLQSGIKHLEWAHSFAGSGGVGVASISKQQAYKNTLSAAADIVADCASKTKEAINQDKQRKAAGEPGQQGIFSHAFVALRLLADKLYAVAQMNLLFVKTQVSVHCCVGNTAQGGGGVQALDIRRQEPRCDVGWRGSCVACLPSAVNIS